jgi:hypothetical protein
MIFSAIILVAAMVVIVINMAYTGVRAPSNGVLAQGEPLAQILKVETATSMYPGRWVTRGTNNDDMIVGALGKAAIGWLGYDNAPNQYKDTHTQDTIYTASDMVEIWYGGKFCVVASLAAGFNVSKGDNLVGWASGELAGPVVRGDAGSVWLKIPFVQKASAYDTGIDIPAGVHISDCMIEVTTAVAGSSIDVGFINAVEGGDEDGLLDGESCVVAGLVPHNSVDATAANNTLGVLLVEVDIKDATGTPVYYSVPTTYKTDGTIKSICYVTSAHAVVGNIWINLNVGGGFEVIAKAEMNKDASSGAADIVVRSII